MCSGKGGGGFLNHLVTIVMLLIIQGMPEYTVRPIYYSAWRKAFVRSFFMCWKSRSAHENKSQALNVGEMLKPDIFGLHDEQSWSAGVLLPLFPTGTRILWRSFKDELLVKELTRALSIKFFRKVGRKWRWMRSWQASSPGRPHGHFLC